MLNECKLEASYLEVFLFLVPYLLPKACTPPSRAELLRIKLSHLLSNQVFLLTLRITSLLHSGMVWAGSLYSYENRKEVPASFLKCSAHLHSLISERFSGGIKASDSLHFVFSVLWMWL